MIARAAVAALVRLHSVNGKSVAVILAGLKSGAGSFHLINSIGLIFVVPVLTKWPFGSPLRQDSQANPSRATSLALPSSEAVTVILLVFTFRQPEFGHVNE